VVDLINIEIQFFIVFLFGLVFGSFATAVAYRVPLDIGWVSGRSKCPSCEHSLGLLDLFPVLSWLLLRGKCRYCKASFGVGYPAAELLLAVMFVLVYWQFSFSLLSAILMFLALLIVIMTIIDFEHYIIPNMLNLLMFLVGGLYCVIIDTEGLHFVLGPIVGLSIGYSLRTLMWVWKGKEGLGMGDVKFLAVVGMFLPLEIFPTFFFLSGMLGIAIALLWKAMGKGERFPFGPALGMAMFVCVTFPAVHYKWQGFVASVTLNIIGV